MARHARAAVLSIGLLVPPNVAQTELSESPIAPGFWSFPTHKTRTAKDVLAACRDHFEIRFADGHFIGIQLQRTERGGVHRHVAKVGRCAFNRETQIETCSARMNNYDGSVLAGTLRSKYSLDGNALTMRVTYDAFPVRCPDDAIWSILNESPPLK
jgi:hypothetical protein